MSFHLKSQNLSTMLSEDLLTVQAYLRDIVDLVLDHYNKTVTIHFFSFPNAYKVTFALYCSLSMQ